jgi:hypothetical protein
MSLTTQFKLENVQTHLDVMSIDHHFVAVGFVLLEVLHGHGDATRTREDASRLL